MPFVIGCCLRLCVQVTFEDFEFPELKVILGRNIAKYQWTLEDPRVVDVAARRIARGRGVKGGCEHAR